MEAKLKLKFKKDVSIKRNEAILHRYYFWNEIKSLKKEKALEMINAEFYVSICTAQEILYDNKTYYKKIITKKPTIEKLQKKYNHFNWLL